MKTIHAATKKTQYQGLDAFYPVLVIQDKESKTDRTIKEVKIFTSDPLPTRKTALKYANIHKNEYEKRS
jgi:hypothetical protein